MLTLETATYLGNNIFSYATEGITVTATEYRQPVFEGWHCHEQHHVTFIAAGGTREQRKNKEQEALPGMIRLFKSGEVHRNTNTRHPSRNINLGIPDHFLTQYGLNFDLLEANPALPSTVLKIYRESRLQDATGVTALLLSLFATPVTRPMPPWIPQLRALLYDTWNETLSLREIGRRLQVHPVTLSKYFPRYFSCTLGEYMRRIRVEKALALMHTPGISLTEVAYACGFADQSHFIRTFKAATGWLPKEYRQL